MFEKVMKNTKRKTPISIKVHTKNYVFSFFVKSMFFESAIKKSCFPLALLLYLTTGAQKKLKTTSS